MNNKVINCAAFIILTALWLGFAGALVFNPALLTGAWQALLGWPLVLQAGVAVLTLPVWVGLWVWNTDWPAWLRLALAAGLALTNLYLFFPRNKAAKSVPAAERA